jgi:WD40 repeat protein
VAGLHGNVKFYDPIDFSFKWESSNRNRKFHMSISAMDFSAKHYVIALGGKEGKLALVDPRAKGLIEGDQAHEKEIINIHFFDKQMQLITICINKCIKVWDIHRLQCLQVFSEKNQTAATISSTAFDPLK